jgi:hypothetical protein
MIDFESSVEFTKVQEDSLELKEEWSLIKANMFDRWDILNAHMHIPF